MIHRNTIFRETYIKGETHGIPKDRFENDFVEFEDGDYLLSDLKQMGWTMEIFRPGSANDLYLFYAATNQPKEKEGGGLKFVILENIEGSRSYDDSETELKVFAYGYGYADGIRHIYFGGGLQKGYFYYPPLTTMASVLLRIEELAQIHCQNAGSFAEPNEIEDNFVSH